MTLTNEFTYIS